MLKFITGNQKKFKEISILLSPFAVEQININLDEIQELDARKIISHKLRQAFKHHPKGEFIIEDDSCYLECLGGYLPGPLIKWFNDTIGNPGLIKLVTRMGNNKAEARALIAYAKKPNKIIFFEGKIKGKLIKPKGKYDFGYDPVFKPDGSNKTFAELKQLGQFELSPRGIAAQKLKRYLSKQSKLLKNNGGQVKKETAGVG